VNSPSSLAAPLIQRLAGHDGAANLADEEALFNALRTAPRPALLFYINDPCVVMGRSNAVPEWANLAALAADGVPLLRRFSGGGSVYHDRDNLNYSFIVPRPLLDSLLPAGSAPGPAAYIAYFRGLLIRALQRDELGGYSAGGVSDILLNGRKISGNAQRIASGLVLHHGTLMLRCPLTAIERYLPIPPNRPGVAHRGFVTGLHEEGRPHSMARLQEWIAAEFGACMGS
jgi:lipoate-protein ligase A